MCGHSALTNVVTVHSYSVVKISKGGFTFIQKLLLRINACIHIDWKLFNSSKISNTIFVVCFTYQVGVSCVSSNDNYPWLELALPMLV